jgi:acetolactate synthase-1/2/3 large subunit
MMEQVADLAPLRALEVAHARALPVERIDQALDFITGASNPVVVTEYGGRDPRAVDALVQLAEMFSLPVMESYRPGFMNFPRTHPLYLAHDAQAVQDADFVLMVDAVAPWYPASRTPKNARVVCISEEYPYPRLPYWGYEVDLALAAAPAIALEALVVRARARGLDRRASSIRDERGARVRRAHEARAAKLREEAERHAHEVPIDPRWAVHALGRAMPPDAVVCEETTIHRGLTLEGMPAEHERSYFARNTGGLGVGLGYALGAKLAMPERPVFAIIGDGAFYYNAVPACLGLAQEYGLPIHVVIFNNARFLSMERVLLKYFPDGAARQTGVHFGASLGPSADFRQYALAHDGHGERVTQPGDIGPAIERALQHEAQGRLSIIDLVLNDADPR